MKFAADRISKFLMNHVGFEPEATKRFVYTGNEGDTFTVVRMLDAVNTEVYTGKLVKVENSGAHGTEYMEGLLGDFSAVKEPGIYRIICGNDSSRSFPIQEGVYDPVHRMLTQFYIWQRCGDGTGWSGKECHTGDSLTDKYGTVHHFYGGHHQSGDLRKWTFGSAFGGYCLSEFLSMGSPRWSLGNVEYDVEHSAKYYLSLISRNGYVFDCTFVPEDYDEAKCKGKGLGDYDAPWHNFMYFDTPTSTYGHTNVVRLLASASVSLKDHNADFAKRCLEGAKKVWDYIMREGRYVGDYDWQVYPPLGHDHFMKKVFDYFYEDSSPMLACIAQAGTDLYKVCGDESVAAEAVKAVNKLSKLLVYDKDGAVDYIRLSENCDRKQETQWFMIVPIALTFAMALESFKDHEDAALWKSCSEAFLKRFEKMAASNLYGKITNFCRINAETGEPYISYQVPSGNKDLADTAMFLIKIAPYFGKERCLSLAQRLLDWIMGGNPYDSSSIECVGYNQCMRAIFGEFLPCQPQMPGGVVTENGPDRYSPDSYGTEYDLPITGAVLYALKLLSEAYK